MVFCRRALRRALRCGNSRSSVFVDIENDIQNDVLPKPNMLKQIIVDNIAENDIQREKQQIAKVLKDEHFMMNMHSRKEIDGVKYPLLNSVGNFIPIRRIVHIDLKGGALKVDYFEKVFEVLKALGATGVLIEWEDMFPFEGRLKSAVNGDAYSMQQVHRILRGAQKYGLDVIPLIQTFGHLEWILK
ncbi:unnamed protein product, partial [Anisakis simplex]|uniref:Hexosaminidase D (inferred by orthology to a human protein) n=1 Tax=Anisakis simplex TaxID=6269 RepID=A0A0M3KDH9_ANISI